MSIQENPFPVVDATGRTRGWRWLDECQIPSNLYPTQRAALVAMLEYVDYLEHGNKCTCPPDERPMPCPKKHDLTDCRAVTRPRGSDANEWHLFLLESKDALPFLAVQIAEAIKAARRRKRRKAKLEKSNG